MGCGYSSSSLEPHATMPPTQGSIVLRSSANFVRATWAPLSAHPVITVARSPHCVARLGGESVPQHRCLTFADMPVSARSEVPAPIVQPPSTPLSQALSSLLSLYDWDNALDAPSQTDMDSSQLAPADFQVAHEHIFIKSPPSCPLQDCMFHEEQHGCVAWIPNRQLPRVPTRIAFVYTEQSPSRFHIG